MIWPNPTNLCITRKLMSCQNLWDTGLFCLLHPCMACLVVACHASECLSTCRFSARFLLSLLSCRIDKFVWPGRESCDLCSARLA